MMSEATKVANGLPRDTILPPTDPPLMVTEDERDVLVSCQELIDAAQAKAQMIYGIESQPALERLARVRRRIERRLGLPELALETSHILSHDRAEVLERSVASGMSGPSCQR